MSAGVPSPPRAPAQGPAPSASPDGAPAAATGDASQHATRAAAMPAASGAGERWAPSRTPISCTLENSSVAAYEAKTSDMPGSTPMPTSASSPACCHA